MAEALERILTLETLDTNLFRSLAHCENFRKTLFGGQVLAQALMAAHVTQNGALPHSLHAYFLRAGSSDIPVIYDVESVRDGRSFASRRVVARQFGRPIFNSSASFHRQEQGYHHQRTFPKGIPDPDAIIKEREAAGIPVKAHEQDDSITPFHFIPVDESLFSKTVIDPPKGYYWIRAIEALPDDPILQLCALAFASDLGLMASALLPHATSVFDPKLMVASVDHAMWFHSVDFKIDEWLLFETTSPWADSGRGFAQSHIYNQRGVLIASAAQEGLMRPVEDSRT